MKRIDIPVFVVAIGSDASAVHMTGYATSGSGFIKTCVKVADLQHVARVALVSLDEEQATQTADLVRGVMARHDFRVFDIGVDEMRQCTFVNSFGRCPICRVLTIKYLDDGRGSSRLASWLQKDAAVGSLIYPDIETYSSLAEQFVVSQDIRVPCWTFVSGVVHSSGCVGGTSPARPTFTASAQDIRVAPADWTLAPPPFHIAVVDCRPDGHVKSELRIVNIRSPSDATVKVGSVIETANPAELVKYIACHDPDIVVGYGVTRQDKICWDAHGAVVCDVEASALDTLKSKLYQVSPHAILTALGHAHRYTNDAIKDTWEIFLCLGIFNTAIATSNITGAQLDVTMNRRRMAQTDMMLMLLYHHNNVLLPMRKWDHHQSADETEAAPETYTGGEVIKPEQSNSKTVLTNIATLDFKSQYPALMAGFNLCHTLSPSECARADGSGPKTLLATLMGKLISERDEVRAKMANCTASEAQLLEIKQLALKLSSNSVYGVTGRPGSRFYQRHLAAQIATCGRRCLQLACKTLCDSGVKVVFGDTDSVSFALGDMSASDVAKLCASINARVPPPVCIGLANTFKKIYLHSAKMYAAIDEKDSYVVKGLGFKKRDQCNVVRAACHAISKAVLSSEPLDALEALVLKGRTQIMQSDNPDDYTVYSILKNAPSTYVHNVPCHVQAAVASKVKYAIGSAIPWIACCSKTTMEYCFVVRLGDDHVINKEYYLKQYERLLRQIPISSDGIALDVHGIVFAGKRGHSEVAAVSIPDIVAALSVKSNARPMEIYADLLNPSTTAGTLTMRCSKCAATMPLESIMISFNMACRSCESVFSLDEIIKTISRDTFTSLDLVHYTSYCMMRNGITPHAVLIIRTIQQSLDR